MTKWAEANLDLRRRRAAIDAERKRAQQAELQRQFRELAGKAAR